MKEQLVTFETAKLAKEKGLFKPNRENHQAYSEDGELGSIFDSNKIHNITAPTQGLLQKWLRDKHDIWVTVETWKFVLQDTKHTIHYQICCDDSLIPKTKFGGKKMIDGFGDTYEEALEQGLQKALELI